MKKVLVFREVRSKNELIPTVCHTNLINRPVSEVIQFPISRHFWGFVWDIIFLCSVDSWRIVMATESGFIALQDLKRQAEEIGLERKEKTKFLT